MCWLEKRRAADAYDSGRTGGGCRNIGQLILMTLAARSVIGETLGCGSWLMHMILSGQAAVGETQGNNAHDAGRTGGGWRNARPLMPMMPATHVLVGETQGS